MKLTLQECPHSCFQPKGLPEISRWRKPPGLCRTQQPTAPARAGETGRSETSFIEFNATTLKQLQIFLSKRPCSMMFFLLLNVITNRFQLRSAHGESSVSRLGHHFL